jgi:bifunctional enzyme CysN/CysC
MTTANEGALPGVIWITGFSASGKTTVGRRVQALLRDGGHAAIFMDGDDLRSIFAHRWGYARSERIELARVYFRLCSHLAAQGNTVIISAVAMYSEVREWVRANIPHSVEVYLRVPEDERRRRDSQTKKIYEKLDATSVMYDVPLNADLVINNYGDVEVEQAAQEIADYFAGSAYRTADLGRTDHWRAYYNQNKAPSKPSLFAEFVNEQIPPVSSILEVGCGNGRDASFFARSGHPVVAIDISTAAIDLCRQQHGATGAIFEAAPLPSFEVRAERKFDVIYSRFVIHAMPLQEEEAMLASAARLLNPGGALYVECRSINDPMAREGEVISPTERIHGHYRRFIIKDELAARLTSAGFRVESVVESSGLAVFGDEDPVVIRVEAIRN